MRAKYKMRDSEDESEKLIIKDQIKKYEKRRGESKEKQKSLNKNEEQRREAVVID